MDVRHHPFDVISVQHISYVYTIRIQSSINYLPLRAIIQNFIVGGENIVFNFPAEEDYIKRNEPRFGETIGRVANGIKDAVVHLNERDYTLDKNYPPNSIHSGFNQDNDGRFLGTVDVTAVLEIEYEVSARHMECDQTSVSVTNHSYFKLTGNTTIDGTVAQLSARKYLPINQAGIPIGTVEDFPTDITSHFLLQESSPAIDNCFVPYTTIDPFKVPLDTRQLDLQLLGFFKHPDSGIHLEVFSTYGSRAGFCVEPGRFINAINQPAWRTMSLLKKGQVYGSKIVYESWKE
ncbi:galactose mutarotase-like domain-containing protein [Aspergillus karnatakaensis]|uniref:galactose mutarotase-like domain-containing protein n=1 Tax=Aspergillus karnatakaensis TaxID=1810916 RepID=UPI003CCDD67D